jgi:HD-GYP domain-containing protein (c-di-GMP phosphodiesterase class II)
MSTADPAILRAARVFDELSKRLSPLGLPIAQIDPSGRLLRSSNADRFAPVAPDHFARVPGQAAPLISSLGDSPAWLVQVGVRLSRRVGWYATIVDSVASTTAPPDVARIASMFHATAQDLQKLDADAHTLSQFAERLAQSYEEVKFLFNASRQMNASGGASMMVARFCEELRGFTPFGWVAVQFADHAGVEESVRGQLFLSGTSRAGEAVDAVGRSLLERLMSEPVTLILRADQESIAARAQCELVAKPVLHDGKLVAVVLAGDKGGDDPDVSSFELQFLDAAAEFLGIFHENVSRFSEQREMFRGTLRAMVASLDAKDPYTRGHSERVGHLASRLALAIGLGADAARRYEIAGLVHDVGKIGIPEAVLCKPGRLTDEEFALIKQHPAIGHGILQGIPSMQDILPGVLHHHEHWNGRGYPHRLAGESIPLMGRVLALADTFDAMSSTRSYRSAMSREQVLAEIVRCSGTQFDPALVEPFVNLDFASFDRMLGESAVRLAA